jgi:hypothetical protein
MDQRPFDALLSAARQYREERSVRATV